MTLSDASYALYTGGSGGLFFYVSNGTSDVLSPDAGAAIWNGAFHHVVGTFDGSTVRLFVDGIQVGKGTTTNVSISYTGSQSDLLIGTFAGEASGEFNWQGAIDEVQVFNRALSTSEIQAIFAAGSAGECKGQPTLSSVAPNTGQQSQQNLSVALTGYFTNWVQGTTTASFRAGITVASLTVNSATSATAVVNIDPAAATGARNVTLTTGSEVDTLANGLTVNPGPVLVSVTPNSGQQGQQNLAVSLTGSLINWVQATTSVLSIK